MKILAGTILTLIGLQSLQAQVSAGTLAATAKDTTVTIKISGARINELASKGISLDEYLRSITATSAKQGNDTLTYAHLQLNNVSVTAIGAGEKTNHKASVDADAVLRSLDEKGDNVMPFDLPDPRKDLERYYTRFLKISDAELSKIFEPTTNVELKAKETTNKFKSYQILVFRFMALAMALQTK